MSNTPDRKPREDLTFTEFLKMFVKASLHQKLLLSAFVVAAWGVTSCEWIASFKQVAG